MVVILFISCDFSLLHSLFIFDLHVLLNVYRVLYAIVISIYSIVCHCNFKCVRACACNNHTNNRVLDRALSNVVWARVRLKIHKLSLDLWERDGQYWTPRGPRSVMLDCAVGMRADSRLKPVCFRIHKLEFGLIGTRLDDVGQYWTRCRPRSVMLEEVMIAYA